MSSFLWDVDSEQIVNDMDNGVMKVTHEANNEITCRLLSNGRLRTLCDKCGSQARSNKLCRRHSGKASISLMACEFIDKLSREMDSHIVHNHKNKGGVITGREHYVNGYRVDGYCAEHQFAIEFIGSYWHGMNGAHNKHNNTSADELFNETMKRLKKIAEKITVYYVVDDDWKNYLKTGEGRMTDLLRKVEL